MLLYIILSLVTSESSCSMNVVSNTSEFTADVLKVVNKIMEGSVRCQEELTMMGGCHPLLSPLPFPCYLFPTLVFFPLPSYSLLLSHLSLTHYILPMPCIALPCLVMPELTFPISSLFLSLFFIRHTTGHPKSTIRGKQSYRGG